LIVVVRNIRIVWNLEVIVVSWNFGVDSAVLMSYNQKNWLEMLMLGAQPESD
jgi:hypothetical protein